MADTVNIHIFKINTTKTAGGGGYSKCAGIGISILLKHDAKAVYKYTTITIYDNGSLTFQILRFIIPVLPVCLT